MPYLLHPPIKNLIQAIPPDDHSVEVESQLWRDIFCSAGLREVHDSIFAGHPAVRISRGWFRTDGAPSDQTRTAGILMWGYPRGARGDRHRQWIHQLPAIAAAAKADAPAWLEYYGGLHKLGGLGISTISKLAYAFGKSFGPCPALILDQRVLSVLTTGRWHEIRELHGLTYANAHFKYPDYLTCLSRVASAGDFHPQQLEFFLFSMGNSF